MSNENNDARAARRGRAWVRIAAVAGHWPIVPIVLLFVGLGVYYSVTVPIFEAPDEPQHYAQVRQQVAAGSLVAHDAALGAWDHSLTPQPPLYYAIGALLTRDIDIDPAQPAYVRNPYDARGEPHSDGNKNVVLHSPAEDWPYRGVSLAVHVLRWFSLLCSVLTVVLSYALGLAIAPTRRSIAAGAAALVAFNPQFLFLSASVTNDTLSIALITALLLVCVRVVNGQAHRWRTPVVLGLLAGAGVLTARIALVALLMIPCAWVGLALRDTRRRRGTRAIWGALALTLLVMLLTAGGWYLRMALAAGDVSVLRVLGGVQSSRAEPLPWSDVLREIRESFVSYWGVFGWMNVLADEFYYTLVHVLTIIGVVGAVLFVLRAAWRAGTLRQHRWPAGLLLLGWIVATLGLLVWWTRTVAGPQGRLLFAAIAPISVLLAMGLVAWIPRHLAPHVTAGAALALALVAAALPARTIAPAYARPERLALDESPASMRALDIAYGDALFLLGFDVLDDEVLAGQDLHLRLYWVALKRMSDDYTFYVQVLGRGGERIGGIDTYPGGGNYPTTLWSPGDVVSEAYSIPIATDVATPVAATVRVGVYAGTPQGSLPAFQADGAEIARNPAITRVRVSGGRTEAAVPPNALEANYGNKLRLEGYALTRPGVMAGDVWDLTLYWNVLDRPMYDYTVFVHLVDQEGQILDQADAPPLGGELPTSFARAGDQIEDPHSLTLTGTLEPGEYFLEVGLYLLETEARLALVDTEQPSDHVRIGPLTVEAAQ